MFNREVDIGAVRVVFRMEDSPFLVTGDSFFFGFPLYPHLHKVNANNIASYADEIKGYFLFISITGEEVVIANDIAGGYRLYWCEIGKTLYFSDTYFRLLELLREGGELTFNVPEYHFWKEHRYTSGGETFFRELHKLPPASLWKITRNGRDVRCYFKDYENAPDIRRHVRHCLTDVEETLDFLAAQGKPLVLFYSGGIDSTLLALLLKEKKIDFTLLFLRAQPPYPANARDLQRAREAAKYFGFPLVEVEVSLEEGFRLLEQNLSRLLLDRHFALLHLAGLEQVRKRYGAEVLLLNGQGADSVLSFGPSETTKGDFAARVLINKPLGLLAQAAGFMVRRTYGENYRAPRTGKEFLQAFFDQYRYYTVVGKEKDIQQVRYLESVIGRLCRNFGSWDALLMYLKMYGFLQGSDNQIVLTSARLAGIDGVVMPYVSPQFIYATVRYKSKTWDILKPKYVIRQGLKQLGVRTYPQLPIEEKPSRDAYAEKVEALFFRAAEQARNESSTAGIAL